jgi:FAD/FMN-containing dehydrogenase
VGGGRLDFTENVGNVNPANLCQWDFMQRLKMLFELAIAIRGGGHNIAGNAVGDGGLLIDLSSMKTVRVDAQRRTASVGPGATLADVDKETQRLRSRCRPELTRPPALLD